MTTEIQYMIGSIAGEFKLKLLRQRLYTKPFAPIASIGQIILEQPLPKKLKA